MRTLPVAAAAVIGVGMAGWCLWRTIRRLRHNNNNNNSNDQPPAGEWQRLGVVSELSLYPVKSGRAVLLEEAHCDRRGLSWHGWHDRNLVLLDSKDQVVYAGVYPVMLGIRATLLADGWLRLTAPHAVAQTLQLAELLRGGRRFELRRPGYRQPLVECAPEHHQWFSRVVLGEESGLRLCVALEPQRERRWWSSFKPHLMPVMALHERSVDEVNSRLSTPNRAHHGQFRGNLLIASDARKPPFDEDAWLWLRIGGSASEAVVLRRNSPCMRCILVNVDVESGTRNADFEPLKTLRSFRLRSHPKDPEMGVYFDVKESGLIRKGAPVFVQYAN